MVRSIVRSKMFSVLITISFLSTLFGACTLRPVKPPQDSNDDFSTELLVGVNKKLTSPVFNLADGTYSVPKTLLITSFDGATIHCTNDGSAPTCNSADCSSPIYHTNSATINYKAIACKTGTDWLPSDVSEASYVFVSAPPTPVVDTPIFSIASGTYTTTQSVNITTTTSGAVVHYTIDGSSPNCSSSSSLPITIGSTTTVKAVACKTGWTMSNMATAIYTITGTLTAPNFSPTAGTYTTAQVVTISAQPGAEIHYTTGSTPATCSSPIYSSPINVSSSTTINAISCLTGWNSSAVSSATYTITGTVANPVSSPAPGTYTTTQNVTLFSSTSGAVIHYTTGSTPVTCSSPVYSSPINVSTTTTINAIACLAGWNSSSIVSFTYVITGTLASPTFSPVAGTYTTAQTVSISAQSGAEIHYTTGSTPATCSSPIYSSPINVSATTTINAIACLTGWTSSSVASATYTITGTVATPIFSPAPGTYTTAQSVSISSATPGAVIHYTTGSTPATCSSPVYSTPISINATTTLNAIACLTGWNTASYTGTYIITGTVAVPTFNPAAGTYPTAQSVSISSATSGAVIHYTTDGSPATCSSSVFSSAIPVNATTTINAIACLTGWTSSTGSATYTITGTVATPVFSPIPGTYTTTQIVSISSSTPGAVVHYTTGSTPVTCSSPVYGTPISVSLTTTINAIACLTNWTQSNVATGTYTITGTLMNPMFNPAGGLYQTTQNVVLSTFDVGASIHYTTDGSPVDCSSGNIYSSPIFLGLNNIYVINAISCQTGWNSSAMVSEAYLMTGQLNPPLITPPSGIYPSPLSVYISVTEPLAITHYSTDLSTLSCNSPIASAPIVLSTPGTYTYYAIQCKPDWITSTPVSATYTVTGTVADPVFTPSGGILTSPTSITISSVTPGAVIHYTLNGADPTCASGSIYSGPITINTPGLYEYKAIACLTNWVPSNVVTVEYKYFCTSVNLSDLSVSVGQLDPIFDPSINNYYLKVPISGHQISYAPTAECQDSIITINGTTVASGAYYGPDALPIGYGTPNLGPLNVVVSSWDGSSTKTYSIDPLVRGITEQEAYIKKNTTPVQWDRFGNAIAMSGNTLVVGVEQENGGEGAVYLYSRATDGSWSFDERIEASDGTIKTFFGHSVDISGDILVVGCPGRSQDRGAVYVYRRSNGDWGQEVKLFPNNPDLVDHFGASVAISGSTIVVGSPNEDGSSVGVNNSHNNLADAAGAAYIFAWENNNWIQKAYLKANNTTAGDCFGSSVAISSNQATIAIGSIYQSTTAANSGAVYVFVNDGGSWIQQAFVKAYIPGIGDHFGHAIKVDGDYLVVGAPYEDSNATGFGGNQNDDSAIDSGAVYVFERILSAWSQESYIKASNSHAGILFGSSVDAAAGNTSVAVIGAPGENSDLTGINPSGGVSTPLTGSGAAYVVVKQLGFPRLMHAYLKASNTDASDYFGAAVATNGDVVVVSAINEKSISTGINGNQQNNSVESAGAVYTFY